jgi:lipoate-protein ligase A
MKNITLQYLSENFDDLSNQVGNNCFVVSFDTNEVSYGENNDYNADYIAENNIPFYNTYRDGGTIVHSPNDIGLIFIIDVKYDLIHNKFLNALKTFIENKLDGQHSVTLDTNDILVDGYKVASGAEKCAGTQFRKLYAAFQISLNVNLELIRNICTKEMVKTPKGLSEFGLTRDDMLQFVSQWWNNFCSENNIVPDREELYPFEVEKSNGEY